MQLTLGKIVESITVLNKIKEQSLDFKVSYWVMRNTKALSDSFNFFIDARENIYKKYCDVINGSYYEIKDGNVKFNIKKDIDVKDFEREMDNLMRMECEDIEPYLLSIDAINNNTSNIKLSTDDMFIIDYLLSE